MGSLIFRILYRIRLASFFLYPVVDCLTPTASKPRVIPSPVAYRFLELKTSYCRNMADCDGARKFNPRVSRIIGVEGEAEKTNDVLMLAGPNPDNHHHVIYFGGDVQVCDFSTYPVISHDSYHDQFVAMVGKLLYNFCNVLIKIKGPPISL